MICGSGSFKYVDEGPWSAPSSPKAAARATSSPRILSRKASKNPYSTRGLDKYSTVVSELEARRAKIMEKVGPYGPSMIWFMHSNTNDWKPIAVKFKDDDSKRPSRSSSAPSSPPHPPPTLAAKEVSPPPPKPMAAAAAAAAAAAKGKKSLLSWREWIELRYYWLVALILILACLTLFGRIFAICCTSMWWYLMPALQGEEAASARRPPWKKDYYHTRRLGDVRTSVNFLPSSPANRSVGLRAHHF